MPEINYIDNSSEVVKLQMKLLLKVASIQKWFEGSQIFISAKLGNNSNVFVINNPILNTDEISQSNFAEIDINNVNSIIPDLDESVYSFLLHFFLHNSTGSNQWVVLINNPYVLEVSTSQCGLLPISQESLLIDGSQIPIFNYSEFSKRISELLISKNEKNLHEFLLEQQIDLDRLISKKKLFLKNAGCVVCGNTMVDLWYNAFQLVYACETQIKLGNSIYGKNLILASDKAQSEVDKLVKKKLYKSVLMNNQLKSIPWLEGELEFEAVIRSLDYMNLQTNFTYKLQTIWKKHGDI